MDAVRDSLDKISTMNQANAWMFETLYPYLGKRILDAGCGIGNLTHFLHNHTQVVAVDYDQEHLDQVRDAWPTQDSLITVQSDISDPKLPERCPPVDTIMCLNTLEHVEDDRQVLKNFYDILPEEGRLVLLVPTYAWLYATLDDAMGHFRRYRQEELLKMMRDASFEIEHVQHFNLFGILGWILQGKILRRRRLPLSSLRLYNRLVPFFRWCEQRMRFSVGMSLIAVGRKVVPVRDSVEWREITVPVTAEEQRA